jgi:uncharacterized protein with NRDE domain
MCLLLLALNRVADRPWLLLGNRDEFHARPTAPAQAWPDAPDVLGGRDLQAAGSWLAVHRSGRFAAVTNVRTTAPKTAWRSRGALVGDFVANRDDGAVAASDYVAAVAARRAEYGPFNLVVGTREGAWFVSSSDGQPRALADGVHAFSNGSPADEWPKMRRLRTRFDVAVASGGADDAAFLDLLFDEAQPGDAELPDTGVGLDLERRLAPIFIRGATYGTRASSLAYARADGRVFLHERRFGPDAIVLGDAQLHF